MRLDDFLDFLEDRLDTAQFRFDPVAIAVLEAITDARKKAERDQSEIDDIWHDMMASSMGQD